MRWLRALDAAATAFVQALWPIPEPVHMGFMTDDGCYEPELTDDELVALRQLIEERFPASVAPVMPTGAAADGPESDLGVPLATDSGHPNLTTYELYDAARAARAYAEQGDPLWLHLADRLEDAAEQTK